MSKNFKHSALAIALATMSGSVLAATTNTTNNLFSSGISVVATDASGSLVTTYPSISSVGDIGFSQQSTTNSVSPATGAPNATIQKYDANSQGNPFAYTLYSVTNGAGITYYTDAANTGALTEATAAELATITGATLNFTGDKTGQIFTSTQTGQTANTTAIVNQLQTSYSSAVNESTTTSLTNAALTNSTGATPAPTPDPTNGQVLVSVGNLVSNQSVTTGILLDASGNPLTDASGNALGTSTNPLYGTQASVTSLSTSPSATAGQTVTSTSALTGNGLTVTSNDQGSGTANSTTVNAEGVALTNGSLTNNAMSGVTLAGTGPSFIQVNNSSLVLHGGSTSTTQTIDDNGVNITSTAGGLTTIDALGNIATNGNVSAVNANLTGDVNALTGNVNAVNANLTGDVNALTGNVNAVNANLTGDVNAVNANLTGDVNAVNGNFSGTVATDRVQAPQIVLADRNQQVDANGSIVKEQIKATAATANRLTGQYKVGNDTVYSLRVFKDGKEVTEYFTKNANGQFQAFTGDVKSIEDGSNAPVAGGTTANTDSIETVGKVTNVITDKNVSYGEEVATRGVTTVKGSLNNGEQLEAVVGTTETTVTKQSVTTGIIGQTTDGANVYGVDVVKDNQKTTVTASGVETTGTVKAATVEATTVNASTINAGKVILANNGTVAEGSKEAVSGGQLHTFQTEVKTEIADFKADVNERVRTVNHRLDNVEKTAYRGVAISLAAQQQVPNIKPGQFAVFGGVGHYEGESAIAFGAVSAINDRLSISGAVGTAGSGDVGGRVGAAYVFGGN